MSKQLKQIFSEVLNISESQVNDNLVYNTIPEWDSILHMSLVAAIDEEYGIVMDTEDIVNLSSFDKAREILAKYGVTGVC